MINKREKSRFLNGLTNGSWMAMPPLIGGRDKQCGTGAVPLPLEGLMQPTGELPLHFRCICSDGFSSTQRAVAPAAAGFGRLTRGRPGPTLFASHKLAAAAALGRTS
jgi:hypothetical protein